ncbi:MAG: hypothetical protein NT150_08195 [Bacteroidetes bacterium]|nr:hypothetical protein [Bacteroidota bacterium]
MLRAFALYVALMISVIVALICGSLLTLYYLNDRETYIYETDARLRSNVESAFNWMRENQIKEGVEVKDLFGENRDSVELKTRSWGLFNLITVKAFSGSRSKNKSALLGGLLHHKNEYALYMGNSNKPLSLCGRTNITGNAFVPEAGVERAYIEGQNFMGNKLINGEQKTSASALPELKMEAIDNISKYLNGDKMDGDSVLAFSKDSTKIIQSFGENALVISSAAPIVLDNIELRGKIIIRSAQWVQVKKSAILEDVLVFAPFVFIDDDFSGSGQFYASDSLLAGMDCKLNYPSVLAVINASSSDKSSLLKVGEGSKIQGAVFSFQEKQSIRNKNILILLKDTEVYGQVYSNGYLELQGEVFGSVVCAQFLLKTPSSVYENHLLNTTIDISQLPKGFVGFYLLKEDTQFEISKWLN